jgi:hypothetical protein
MAENTFRSPGFYDREIDQSAPVVGEPEGIPAGVIGTAKKGPAFVPVTVSNFNEFVEVFGGLDSKKHGPYAANEYLKNRSALTYVRVLGAGVNATSANITTTRTTGRTTNAGFKIEGVAAPHDAMGRHANCVQFLASRHAFQTNEAYGYPMFTDNDSFGTTYGNLIRGMLFTTTSSRVIVSTTSTPLTHATLASMTDSSLVDATGNVRLIISSTLGSSFSNDDGLPGVKIFSASMDPTSNNYFAKILNTNAEKFAEEQHLLYADFAVDAEVASAIDVGVLSGSTFTSNTSGEASTTMRAAYGAFDARYSAPKTTWYISQPFGATEHDLFYFEARDDGEYANNLYKITISNLKASLDDSYQYGTFTVLVRDMNDTDANQMVLEQFSNCSLDPNSDNYVAKVVGDRKVYFNFDSTIDSDKRLVSSGKYENKSKYVRIVMSSNVEKKVIPATTLPFGFRGHASLKTNDSLTDTPPSTPRITGYFGDTPSTALSGSIVPPVPFRFKVTIGEGLASTTWPGQPSPKEITNPLLTWGVKFERNTSPLNANVSSDKNALLTSYTKFLGIQKLDTLLSGTGADSQNNNKFTLSKVAFSQTAITQLTSSVSTHMREAAYIRDGKVDPSEYTIADGVVGNRITFATILAKDTAPNFNRFSTFAKFTNFMYGGWDGVNILDRDSARLNDKSVSFDAGGGAATSFIPAGFSANPNGTGQSNNGVASYMTAINLMTDPMVVNQNVLSIPGIRETFVTDYASQMVRDYGLSLYLMDIPGYDEDNVRLYDESVTRPDVTATSNMFNSRNVDNNYVATYFSDVYIDDATNYRKVKVPASVAALGAIGFNDRLAYPWFAPAGFNRAALDFVSNVSVRLTSQDRDTLYDSRINPIAVFPKLGFVIYGQKTLQIAKSSLDRVNVRRLLLEVKRVVTDIANTVVFENPAPEIRNKFVSDVTQQLGFVQLQTGVERFNVICNETNNTEEDEENNRMNAAIVIIPTRTIEFVTLDFVITTSGVTFSS